MTEGILLAIGGVGLFLLGMLVLTEGLKALAGDALRAWLARVTDTPLSGVLTGAATTAVIQSSSATTVMAIGFVGAGLLSFPQALGVIFGANIGTTMTGWLVAIVGFKLHLGSIALPLVLIGVALRMFTRGRLRDFGWALAGFSLLFIGIDAMQEGLAGFRGVVTPDDFPSDTLGGRLMLVLIGIGVTVIAQSSSAGLAAALVALSTGTISLPQAAAMVIGMNVGTTCTAVLASLGGSVASKRTSAAHVVFNFITGAVAFVMLPVFTAVVARMPGGGDGQVMLAAFHTAFNVLGVALFLPVTFGFARLIERLVPERDGGLLRRLDRRLLSDPQAAADALAGTVAEIAGACDALLERRLGGRAEGPASEEIGAAIEAARAYAQDVRTSPDAPLPHTRHLAAIHALDHLGRLHHRLGQAARIAALPREPRLRRLSQLLRKTVARREKLAPELAKAQINRLRRVFRDERHSYREATLDAASRQVISGQTALDRLDAVRWLHRVSYHLWRIAHHRAGLAGESVAETAQLETAAEED